MTDANVGIVREGYAAFSRGDLEGLRKEFFAPDLIWHYAGKSQLAGHYHGVDEVVNWLVRSFELSDGTLAVELHDVVGNDEHVVALVTVRATRQGKQLFDQGVHVFHLSEGRATQVWLLPGDLYTNDAFWG
jgi:uncharacterized protein